MLSVLSPVFGQELIEVIRAENPGIIADMDKIVRTHSCRPGQSYDLLEHLVALIASELPGYDRQYLRGEAFKADRIDADCEKVFCIMEVARIKADADGWDITTTDGWSLWLNGATDGYEPQVGSVIWEYTICFSRVLGVVVDGHVFRYKTVAQAEGERLAKIERDRANEREKFPEYDARVAKLPDVFQQRIKKFQRAEHFREDLEGYEVFVCEQAVQLAERLKTTRKLRIWSRLNYQHQMEFIPELNEAGHTGNSLGAACCLARLYLENPILVPKMHGALAPLVGSNAYLPPEEQLVC